MSGADGEGGDEREESFEARLRAARTRHGLEPSSGKDGRSGRGGPPLSAPGSALGVGMRVGVELVSALAVAVAIGWTLDHWLHTTPVFIALFVLLGGAAGVANVWRLMGPGRDPTGRRSERQ
jgi:ATP synthase protein I